MQKEKGFEELRSETGTIPPEDVSRHTGLELMQRMVDGHYPSPPMAKQMNFRLEEVSEGRAVFRGAPGAHHLNPAGVIHGGWAATILDSALGCAVQTTMGIGETYTTAEFKVNLIRRITPETGEVICEGRVIHKGRSLAVSEATLKDSQGRLLAMGTETCAILTPPNSG